MEIEKYTHHGIEVSVLAHVKGLHKNNCLCFAGCKFFKPGTTEHCPIASENFALCVKHNIVTPVFECPKFAR